MEGIFLNTDQGLHVDLTCWCHAREHQTFLCGMRGNGKGLGPESCQWSNIKNRVRLLIIQIDHSMKLLNFNVFPDCPSKIFSFFSLLLQTQKEFDKRQ